MYKVVKSFWYEGRGKDQKEAYLTYLRALPELDILKKKLNEKISDIQKQRLSLDGYDKASWPYLQAELNGEEKMATTILSYLDFS